MFRAVLSKLKTCAQLSALYLTVQHTSFEENENSSPLSDHSFKLRCSNFASLYGSVSA